MREKPRHTAARLLKRRSEIGGKAAAIEAAQAAGLPVPPFITLTPAEITQLHTEQSRDLLLQSVAELGRTLAVRSSGASEDGDVSFAGQLDSAVGVTGAEALLDAVARVAASGRSSRVTSYGAGVSAELGSVAVIVQRHISTEWAGVAFCRDPLTYQPEIVVEAVRGAGELLVGGTMTPARIVLDRETLEPLFAPDTLTAVPPDHVVRSAARLALRCEELFGFPQDVEWGWDGETVWLLQTRPMTALGGLDVYSDTFASEVLPGLIKPLVFDVGDIAVNNAWGRMLTAICGPLDVDRRRMAGLAASRAYFNDTLLGDVLTRGGLPENTLEAIEHGERPRLRGGSYRRMLASAGRLTAYLARNARWLRILERELPAVRRSAIELGAGLEYADNDEVALRLRDLLAILEQAAYLSALTMIGMGLLGARAKAAARILGSDAPVLDLAGGGGIEPTADLARVADHLRRLPASDLDVLAAAELDEIESTLSRTADGAAALEAMTDLLARWGHVATVNTDFSSDAWGDDPTPLWRVAAQMRAVPPGAKWQQQRQTLPWPLRGHVDRLRRHVTARDHVNDTLALTYHALRLTSRRAGELLTPAVIATRDDVCFLHYDELLDALSGHSPSMHAVVAERRTSLAADADVTPPHRLWGLRLPPRWRMLGAEQPAATGGLTGTPASAGRFTGTARVVADLSTLPVLCAQDILVVPHADVGWTPLFGTVGAVVANSGGGLSHAAIVAREFGIPAVLGVPDATALIPDGARILVDGSEGLVSVLCDGQLAPAARREEGERTCAT